MAVAPAVIGDGACPAVYSCELAKLEGIFTPLLVPLDERGQINEAELRRFISWLIDQRRAWPVPQRLDRRVHPLQRRKSAAASSRSSADQARGRVPILAGAAEANVKETLAACEAYAAMGARAVAIVSPFYYKLTPESVYAYFAEIARHTPIDITLVQHPDVRQPDRRAHDPPPGRRIARASSASRIPPATSRS